VAQVRFHLHVRPLRDGRVVVTPVRFPDLESYGSSAGEARRAATTAITGRVRGLGVAQRNALLRPSWAALERVEVRLSLGAKSEEGLTLPVGVVVVKFEPPPADALLAVAPAAAVELKGVDREDLLARMAVKLGKTLSKWSLDLALEAEEPSEAHLDVVELPVPIGSEPTSGDRTGTGFLAQVGEELTAAAGAADRGVDHREEVVLAVLAALASTGRSSVILVGPPDVGKTAVVYEVARRLSTGQVPAELAGRPLWRVTANELIAGAQYTGQWQQRGRELVAQARELHAIVAMGDPTGVVAAGRWSESDNNLSRLLRPHMEDGRLTLICECTAEGLAAARIKEPSFIETFRRIDVPEPSIERTQEIIASTARRFHAVFGVRADESALAAAIEFPRRFERYRSFPGKAVRLLEETVRSAVATSSDQVTRTDVAEDFTARTGLPLALLSDDVPLRVHDVTEHFEARVLGQPDAVRAMVDLVIVLKAALNDPQKPLGSFLFVGPTGVGKTELAKALAELLFGSRDRVIRLDMGEYAAADAVQKLVGTPWDSEDSGELTRRVREQPFCVVLLDEIEKAHRTVFDVLLGVLGEGRLTDAAGRTADMRSAIIIMTSNLGAEGQRSGALGFTSAAGTEGEVQRLRAHYTEQVERFFRPEFFNRIDRLIVFDPLDEDAVRRIARRELGRLLMREGILRRQLLVEVDEPVVHELAVRGFHPRYGARPLQRVIERAIINPLAARLIERRAGPGDLVWVRLRDGGIDVDVQPVTTPERRLREHEKPQPAADVTLVRATEAARALAQLIEKEESLPVVTGVRTELSDLVTRTHGPDFWDVPADARRTLARVYELQRVLDSLTGLRERAQGLAELGRQLRMAKDRRRLPELRQALDQIEGRLELVRLELAGAALHGGSGTAVVRVTALGPHAEGWARELLEMYVAWAERTGREASTPHESDGGIDVRIDGRSSRELLEPEGGLHRLVPRKGDALMARVVVTALGEERRPAAEVPVLVRVYEESRRQVRDPRTGTYVKDPAKVLREGRIDPFLIAAIGLR